MSEPLKQILVYHSLITLLLLIISSSFFIFPLGGAEAYLGKIAIGLTLFIQPISVIFEINELSKVDENA